MNPKSRVRIISVLLIISITLVSVIDLSASGSDLMGMMTQAFNSISTVGSIPATDSIVPKLNNLKIEDKDVTGKSLKYNRTVVIVPSGEDNRGIQDFEYRINSGAWTSSRHLITSPSGVDAVSYYAVLDSDGKYKVEFRAVDTSKNYSAIKLVNVEIDKTLPVLTSIADQFGKSINPQLESGVIWVYSQPVTITAGGSDSYSGVAGYRHRINDGSWVDGNIVNISVDGKYKLDFTVVDRFGNVSTEKSIQVNKDSQAPALIGNVNQQWQSVESLTATIKAEDSISGISKFEYSKDNGAWTEVQGDILNLQISKEGSTSISCRAFDGVGFKTEQNYTVRIDRTKPVINVIDENGSKLTPLNQEAYKYSEPVKIVANSSDSVSGVKQRRFRINSGEWIDGNVIELDTSGKWNVEFEAIDEAGNTINSGTFAVETDFDAPEITISGTDEKWKNAESVTVKAEATDADSGVGAIEVSQDGINFSQNNEITITDEGETTVYFRASDMTGNEVSKSIKVRIDRTFPVIEVKDDNGKVLNGSEEQYIYTQPVTLISEVSDMPSGIEAIRYRINGAEWSTGGLLKLNESGVWKVEFEASDFAGNKKSSGVISILLDVDAPEITIIGESESWQSAESVTIKAEVKDAFSEVGKVEYSSGGDWVEGSDVVVTEEGETRVSFRAYDKLGNSVNKDTYVRIDRTKPVVTVDNPAEKFLSTDEVLVKCIANDTLSGVDNDSYEYRIGSGEWTKGSSALVTVQGKTIVGFRVKDKAGNIETVQREVLIDRTLPLIEDAYLKTGINEEDPILENDSYTELESLYLFIDADDGAGLDKGEISEYKISISQRPGQKSSEMSVDPGENSYLITGLSKGINYVSIKAVDLAGNISEAKVIRVKLDEGYPGPANIRSITHPYAKSVHDAVNSRNPVFVLSAESAGISEIKEYRYSLKKGEETLYEDVAIDSGTLKFENLEDNEPDQYYELLVWIVSGSGKMSLEPSIYRFRIDSAPPRLLKVTSDTHPVEGNWYSSATASFAWNKPIDFTGVKTFYYKLMKQAEAEVYLKTVSSSVYGINGDPLLGFTATTDMNMSFELSGFLDGQKQGNASLTVFAEDYAGNRQADQFSVSYDIEKPGLEVVNGELLVIYPLMNEDSLIVEWGNPFDNVAVSGIDAGISLYGSGQQEWTWAMKGPAAGTHTFKGLKKDQVYIVGVRVSDSAGNSRIYTKPVRLDGGEIPVLDIPFQDNIGGYDIEGTAYADGSSEAWLIIPQGLDILVDGSRLTKIELDRRLQVEDQQFIYGEASGNFTITANGYTVKAKGLALSQTGLALIDTGYKPSDNTEIHYSEIKLSQPPFIMFVSSSGTNGVIDELKVNSFIFKDIEQTSFVSGNFVINKAKLKSDGFNCYIESDGIRVDELQLEEVLITAAGSIKGGRIKGDFVIESGKNRFLIKDGHGILKDGCILVNEAELFVDEAFSEFTVYNFTVESNGVIKEAEGFRPEVLNNSNLKIGTLSIENGNLILKKGSIASGGGLTISLSNMEVENGMLNAIPENMPSVNASSSFNSIFAREKLMVGTFKAGIDGSKIDVTISAGDLYGVFDGYHNIENCHITMALSQNGTLRLGLKGDIRLTGEVENSFGRFGIPITDSVLDHNGNFMGIKARNLEGINASVLEMTGLRNGFIDFSFDGESLNIEVEGYLVAPGNVLTLTLGKGIPIDNMTISPQGRIEQLEALVKAGTYNLDIDELDFEGIGLPEQSIDKSAVESVLESIKDKWGNYLKDCFVKAVYNPETGSIGFEVSGELILSSGFGIELDNTKIFIEKMLIDMNGRIRSIKAEGILPHEIDICGLLALENGSISLVPDESGVNPDIHLQGTFRLLQGTEGFEELYIDIEELVLGLDGKIKKITAGRNIYGTQSFIGNTSLRDAYAGIYSADGKEFKLIMKGSVILPIDTGYLKNESVELNLYKFVIDNQGEVEELDIGASLPGTTPFIGSTYLEDAEIKVVKNQEGENQAEFTGAVLFPGLINDTDTPRLDINSLKVGMDGQLKSMDVKGVLEGEYNFIGGSKLKDCGVGLIKEDTSAPVEVDLSGKIILPEMEVESLSRLELNIESLRFGLDGTLQKISANTTFNNELEFRNGIRLKNGNLGITMEEGETPVIQVGGILVLPDSAPGNIKGAELIIKKCKFDLNGKLIELDASLAVDQVEFIGSTKLKQGRISVFKTESGNINISVEGSFILPETAHGALRSMEIEIDEFCMDSNGDVKVLKAGVLLPGENELFGDFVVANNLSISASMNDNSSMEFSVGGAILFKGDPAGVVKCPLTLNSFVITSDGKIKALDIKASNLNTGLFGLLEIENGALSVVADSITGEKLIGISGTIRTKDVLPNGLKNITVNLRSFTIDLNGNIRSFDAGLGNISILDGLTLKNGSLSVVEEGGVYKLGIGGKMEFGDTFPQGIRGMVLNIGSFVIDTDGNISDLDVGLSGINASIFGGLNIKNGSVNAIKGTGKGEVEFTVGGNLSLGSMFPENLQKAEIVLNTFTLSQRGIKDFNASIKGLSSFEFLGGIKVQTNEINISKDGLALSGSLTLPSNYPEGFRGMKIDLKRFEFGWDGEIKAIQTVLSQFQIKLAGFKTDIKDLEFTKDCVKIGSLIITLPDNMDGMKLGITDASISKDGKFSGKFLVPDLNKELAGCNVSLKSIKLDVDKRRISFDKAVLSLPDELGGLSAALNGVSLEPDGIKFSGGAFRLPNFKVSEAVTIGNAYVDFRIDSQDSFYIEGGAAITIKNVGGFEGMISFTNISEDYPIGLKRAEFTFYVPGLGIPIANSGLYINSITGGIAFGPPDELPEEIQGMFESGMRIKMGVGIRDGSGGNIVSGSGSLWIDLTNCGIATESKVTVLKGLASGEMVSAITSKGFYGRVGVEMKFARGEVTIYIFRYDGKMRLSGSSKLEIGIPKGAIIDEKILFVRIRIPSSDWWIGSVNADFGLFTNGDTGVKAYVDLPWGIGEIGAFVSNRRVHLGGVGKYKLYVPSWAKASENALFASLALTSAISMPYGGDTLAYTFNVSGNGSRILNAPSGTGTERIGSSVEENQLPVGRLLFTIAYPDIEPEVTLVSPSGKRYGIDSANLFVSYHEFGMLIAMPDPEPGVWNIELAGVENKEATDVQVYGISSVPEVSISSVENSASSLKIVGTTANTIEGSEVEILLSESEDAHSGVPVGMGKTDSEGRYNIDADLSAVENGKYYVVAVLKGVNNLPDVYACLDEAVEVSMAPTPLKAVTGLMVGEKEDGVMEVMFEDVNGLRTKGFKLYIDNTTINEKSVIDLGYLQYVAISGYQKGEQLSVKVVPYDDSMTEGAPSSVALTIGGEREDINRFTTQDEINVEVYSGHGVKGEIPIYVSNPEVTREAYDFAQAVLLEVPEGLTAYIDDSVNLTAGDTKAAFEIGTQHSIKPGIYTVRASVENRGNREIRSEITINVEVKYPDISVSDFEPKYIDVSEGMDVEIYGTDFNDQTRVLLNGSELKSVLSGNDLLTVTLPEDIGYGVCKLNITGANGDIHAVEVEVLEPDFMLLVSKKETFITRGKSDEISAFIKTFNGFDDMVQIGVDSLPEGWSYTIDKKEISDKEQAVLKISVPEKQATGEYYFDITTQRDDVETIKVTVTEEDHGPYITRVSKRNGLPGDTIRIYGGCFTDTGKAFIGDKELKTISWSGSMLEAEIEEGTTSGVISIEAEGKKCIGPKFNILTDIRMMVVSGDPDGLNGYYITRPEIELHANSEVIPQIYYSINDGEFTQYNQRIKLTEGINKIDAYSTGSDGTVISRNSWTVRYDCTAPVSELVYDGTQLIRPGTDITIKTSDNLSGLSKTYYRWKKQDGNWSDWLTCENSISILAGGKLTVEYYSEDLAGNKETVKSTDLGFIDDWNNNKVWYKKGDLVFYNGRVYRCILMHRSWKNGYPDKFHVMWVLDIIKVQGVPTRWEPQIEWKAGDLAEYNGKVYICTSKHVSLKHWYPHKRSILWKSYE